MDTFLTPQEVAELTGIRRGTRERPYSVLQVEWLLAEGYPAKLNRAGCVIVPRTAIEGKAVSRARTEKKISEWTPNAWRA